MELSVILPVRFDERVYKTIYELGDYLKSNHISHELIVTGVLFKPNNLPKNTLYVNTNGKKGTNLITGVNACRGDHILFIDADLPANPEYIIQLLPKLARFDVVLGNRDFSSQETVHKIPLLRSSRTILFRCYVSLLFPKLRKYDTQYGFKLFKGEKIKQILKSNFKHIGLAFDIELAIKIQRSGFSVLHVPLPYNHNGDSVINSVMATIELIYDALRIRLENR